ncbi:LysR family transcriptional regulator [Marinobacter hydrocarbonoclasticus]|nr:LysR family transcriptional regulator [Marinobacter nauticus]
MDKFQTIRLFVQTARLGSFTAAANDSNLTQGAVSKRIAWLESQIGFALFYRNSRRIQLTPQGQEYLTFCERQIEQMAVTEARLKGDIEQVTGELKLSVPSAMATQLLARPLSDFMELHPALKVSVSVNDRLVDLINDDVDIALRASKLADSGYRARHLFNHQAVLLASPAYLAQHAHPGSPEALSEHRCLTYSLSSPSNRWPFCASNGAEIRITVPEHFRSDNPEMLLKMAVLGRGIAVLPRWMAQPHLETGELITLLDDYAFPSMPMYALFKAGEYQPYRIRAFIDHLIDRFQGDSPPGN